MSQPAWTLFTYGASRGNPGQAGAGAVLFNAEGHELAARSLYLGECTNNVAEYRALIWGLKTAVNCGVTDLVVRADSELVVKQMRGEYRVKHPGLQPLFARAKDLARELASVRYEHVRREQNTHADELANAAMDSKCDVGDVPDGAVGSEQGSLF